MAEVSDDFLNKFTYEMIDDLEYVRNAYYEVMRLDTPFPISSTNTVTKKCTISGVEMEPGQAFFVHMQAHHNDPDEWIEPSKFVPERFDPNSPYYKRPDGGKRSPLAFNPFLGGQRI